jgi:hypothetical protein
MFLVNVRSMYVLPSVADAELMKSKLNLDFIKFTNDLLTFTCLRATTLSYDVAHRTVRS